MSLRGWLRDQGIGFLLSTIFEVLFVSLVYALLALQPQLWWLWTALTILFFSVIMANLAPILLYPLFYKFTPLPDGELKQTLLELAERAHTKVRGVYLMKMSNRTTATNAALMGLGNTRRIVLGDTMTDRYSSDEIEVVLAHELGHHVHHDIWKLIISQSVFTLVGLFAGSIILHSVVEQFHYYRSLTDPATIPFLLLLIGFYGLIIMPLSNGYTRHIEYQADEYALQSTGKIEPFKSAMRRLANQNLAEIEPSPLVEFLFYSHPSIKKRLAHADEFAQRTGANSSTQQLA
jgi:STE24 endopeptidase